MSLMVDGMRNLSVPLFNGRGVLCALTSGYIGQVDQVMSPEEALVEIQRAANQLSPALGSSGMVKGHLLGAAVSPTESG